ncbi:trypsin-like serine protease [Micromonospora sp. NBC_01405]|uniref:trypsin-like serine protease n=1 Tax=Micromonospora sp. NBC_01405 TaxID=2903589 RepID=UPI00324F12B6
MKLATDGSGLTVIVDDLSAVARGAKAAKAGELALLQRISATRSRTGIPITVSAGRANNPEFQTRAADTSPYWGGAMLSINGAACTSGFSMYASGDPSRRFTLSAAHCFDFLDGVPVSNGVGSAMGTSDFVHELYDRTAAYDLGVVRLGTSKSNQPYIYVGNNPADGVITVSGYRADGVPEGGNYCVHGITAVNCNLISDGQNMDCSGWPPEGRCVYTIEYHPKTPGTVTACKGDSGGPIYNWTNGGSSVLAAGIVSWGENSLGSFFAPVISEAWGANYYVSCQSGGGMSVVATAVNTISGLRVATPSTP